MAHQSIKKSDFDKLSDILWDDTVVKITGSTNCIIYIMDKNGNVYADYTNMSEEEAIIWCHIRNYRICKLQNSFDFERVLRQYR